MKKLYDYDRVEFTKEILGVEEHQEELNELQTHLTGFTHAAIIHNTVVKDNYNSISIEDYKIFNNHIKDIANNLNISLDKTPMLSMESLDNMSVTVLNRHFSMEGFMQDLWGKIKEAFSKVHESLKKFAKEHLTSLGRLKSSLTNLKAALDKPIELKDNSERKPAGKIKSVFKVNDTVTSTVVLQVTQESNKLIETSKIISRMAIETSKTDILDKAGIEKFASLKKEASSHNTPEEQKPNNESDKIPDKISETDTGGSTTDNEADDDKIFKEFMTGTTKILLKHKDKPIGNGKKIVNVTTDGAKITIETEIDSTAVTKMVPGEKSDLVNILGICLKMIASCEADMKNLSTINDNFSNGLGKLKDAINTLDAKEHANLNKYINTVNKELNNRFVHYRNFFTHYNKVVKAIHTNSVVVGQGCVAYIVESLKYYG